MTAAKDKAAETAAASGTPANLPPAQGMDGASGAIIEPAVTQGVDTTHPAIDNNPREGTTVGQNTRDMNDPRRRRPNDRDFAGQGIDPTPYGKKAEPKKSKAKKGR
ncbi:hypothetical protein [Aliihoeflea sp. 40Bstr573]|uniref:hypothetical protein n=1 Tax=Aliihoeflea sp. 40Bstr573 TaxID=2696467 RepID=UPI002094B357|nr:hypothetical protein [Aliihoeflea sp. 40Bstr573]MCO6386356.1 hypothetical protein [Aliihoeflea sp. 40Bstr573]